jgi:hypothetical protein
MGNANLNPRTQAKVNGAVGDRQRRLPAAKAQPRRDRDREDPNRGHSRTVDHGWREVAQTALDFIKRFT